MKLHRQDQRHDRGRMGEPRQRIHRAQVRLVAAVPALGDVDDLHVKALQPTSQPLLPIRTENRDRGVRRYLLKNRGTTPRS